jgi:hypothetical protein
LFYFEFNGATTTGIRCGAAVAGFCAVKWSRRRRRSRRPAKRAERAIWRPTEFAKPRPRLP